jgi:hypothetical protein
MVLETEQKTYERALPTLLAHHGKFVLVRSDGIVGVYDTYADALREGYRQFQLGPFLVKQICGGEQMHLVTRPMITCQL